MIKNKSKSKVIVAFVLLFLYIILMLIFNLTKDDKKDKADPKIDQKKTETQSSNVTKALPVIHTDNSTTSQMGGTTGFISLKSTKKNNNANYVIVIDAGHQAKQNKDKEPIGPGAKEKKPKVSSGTQGVATGIPEYKVNLQVALKLRDALKAKGYTVIMIREKNDVNISNAERAKIANKNDADVFIRIHCNGSEDSSVKGALTMCPTKDNPYCSDIYKKSRKLSESVINHLCESSGAKNQDVYETDTMSGINWCEVPVTIVEMGYMTNKQEDKNLCDSKYQGKLVKGMVDGIEEFLKK